MTKHILAIIFKDVVDDFAKLDDGFVAFCFFIIGFEAISKPFGIVL